METPAMRELYPVGTLVLVRFGGFGTQLAIVHSLSEVDQEVLYVWKFSGHNRAFTSYPRQIMRRAVLRPIGYNESRAIQGVLTDLLAAAAKDSGRIPTPRFLEDSGPTAKAKPINNPVGSSDSIAYGPGKTREGR